MKKDRFFGFLGRANAVILFLVGLGDELWRVEIDPATRTLVRHDKVEVVPVGNPGG